MSKASDKALEVYPPHLVGDPTFPYGQWDVHGLERRCYQDGYEQAEKDLGWHSVDESLPPIDEEVIVLRNYWVEDSVDPLYKVSFGHIVDKNIAVDYDGWNVPSVKYWMPMPKLPKEEEK